MADELGKAELQAAADRAAQLSLGDDDVALVTAKVMPARLKVRGEAVETAGTEVHGGIQSYTRKEVDKALESWGSERSARRGRPPGSGGGRRRGQRAGDRRVGTGQQAGANAGAAATESKGEGNDGR